MYTNVYLIHFLNAELKKHVYFFDCLKQMAVNEMKKIYPSVFFILFKFSDLYLCKQTYLICAMFVSSFKTCLYDVQMLILYQLNKNYIISVFKSLDE